MKFTKSGLKVSFVIVLGLIIILGNTQTQAQRQLTEPLTLKMLVTGLKSDSSGMSLARKNEYIKLRVNQLGVDFRWTTRVEKSLRDAGANDSLITVVRRKAPKVIDEKARAEANKRREKRQQEIKEYTKAIEANPKDFEAYKKRAALYERQVDNRLAMEDYIRVLEIKPDDQVAKYRLSRILDRYSRYFYIPNSRRRDSSFNRDAYVKGYIAKFDVWRRRMSTPAPFYKGDRNPSYRKRKKTVNVLAFINDKGKVVSAIGLSSNFRLERSAVRAAKISSFFEKKSSSKSSLNDWVVIIYEYER